MKIPGWVCPIPMWGWPILLFTAMFFNLSAGIAVAMLSALINMVVLVWSMGKHGFFYVYKGPTFIDVANAATFYDYDHPGAVAFTPDGLRGSAFETDQPGRFRTEASRHVDVIVKGTDGLFYQVSCRLAMTIFDPNRFVCANIMYDFCADIWNSAVAQLEIDLAGRVPLEDGAAQEEDGGPLQGETVLAMHEEWGIRHTIAWSCVCSIPFLLERNQKTMDHFRKDLGDQFARAKGGDAWAALGWKGTRRLIAELKEEKRRLERLVG